MVTRQRRLTRESLLAQFGAAAVCLVFPYVATATSVSNCEDSGPGSLRQAVLDTPDGGTIDATGLAGVCSVITVKTGAMSIAYDNLTVVGPGKGKLAVTAELINGGIHRYYSRIFTHTGRGTLTLQDITIAHGTVNSPTNQALYGGCIFSSANVSLVDSDVLACEVSSPVQAFGGAIKASGTVYLLDSRVLVSQAIGTNYGGGGGGIDALNVTLRESTVAGNSVSGSIALGSTVSGGGIRAAGIVDIASSTISGNSASGGHLTHYGSQSSNGGGLYVHDTTASATISDSTISGNSAGYYAGLSIFGASVSVINSTVAFNASSASHTSGSALSANAALIIDSDIFSGNTISGGTKNDLVLGGYVSPAGGHDLVFSSSALLPAGTLRATCPLLGPLTYNGGPTQTHALWSHSPAIDAGDNSQGLPYDQRGAGYPRASGSSDIGAYEVNKADELFGSGFDGC